MKVPNQFDTIRPVEPEELQTALQQLLADPQFLAALSTLHASKAEEDGSRMMENISQLAAGCRTNLDFQKTFIYPFVNQIEREQTAGLSIDSQAITDKTQPYTFISNHRDIVLDSAFLAKLLIDDGFPDTVEIAIGNNLLAYPWIERLVRINKAFIVRRGLSLRETLNASRLLSEYMHFAITTKHQNIWIAQREGRAKDSNDRTQEALLKMMCMGGTGTPAEQIQALRLTPLTISYEYDPCDFLKAQEFQQKRDNPNHKKSQQDDIDNMRTGIFGYKGRVHYHIAAPVTDWIREHQDLPKADFFTELAAHIDQEIHRNYRLFAVNLIALDMLEGTHHEGYTDSEYKAFDDYVQKRIAKIRLPHPDYDFLRERILTMYANPARNYMAAQV